MLSNDKNTYSDLKVIEDLDQRRGKIISRTGGWFPGKGVYSHGYNMLEELVGQKSYFQILILNATGKMVERRLADWIEGIYGCLSWPDPRIWCNQVGALAGAARTSVVAATAIGVIATDSRSYGVLPLMEGVAFIQSAFKKFSSGMSPVAIVDEVASANRGKPYIVGYIRPIAKGDERLEAMERVSKNLDFDIGEHLALAYQIEKVLMEKYDEGNHEQATFAAEAATALITLHNGRQDFKPD